MHQHGTAQDPVRNPDGSDQFMSGQKRGPDFGKFGCGSLGVALHVIEAAKPSQPLPLPIHHQYLTWWDPMWPRTYLPFRPDWPPGCPIKTASWVLSGWHLGNAKNFPPKVFGWASGFFTIFGNKQQNQVHPAYVNNKP